MVWAGATLGDQLVTNPARERDVRHVAPVHVPDRAPVEEELGLSELARIGRDPRPARHLVGDPLPSVVTSVEDSLRVMW